MDALVYRDVEDLASIVAETRPAYGTGAPRLLHTVRTGSVRLRSE
jgi:hypothetical protein